MKFRNIAIVIAVLVVIILAVFVGTRLSGGSPASTAATTTATVTKGTIHTTLNATGTIISANQVDLNFDTAGKLTELHVGVNQAVTNGQLLAVLEPTTRGSNVELTSSIDGTVIHIGAKVGEQLGGTTTSTLTTTTTTSGSPAIETPGFITVADLNNLQVKMGVDQADVAKLSVNQAVTISLDAIPDKNFTGAVVFIDPIPTNSQNVITYTVYTNLASADQRVKLGMSANVSVNLGQTDNVLLVPNLAVKTVNGKKVVTKVVTGKQTDVDVTVGVSDDKNTEIRSGLSNGDKVIVGEVTVSSSGGGGGPFGGR